MDEFECYVTSCRYNEKPYCCHGIADPTHTTVVMIYENNGAICCKNYEREDETSG